MDRILKAFNNIKMSQTNTKGLEHGISRDYLVNLLKEHGDKDKMDEKELSDWFFKNSKSSKLSNNLLVISSVYPRNCLDISLKIFILYLKKSSFSPKILVID